MKRIFLFNAAVCLLLLVGCNKAQKLGPCAIAAAKPAAAPELWYEHGAVDVRILVHTGPVRIVRSVYELHETLEDPDGKQFEFHHCRIEESLANEGAIVDIAFTGDWHEMLKPDCAVIESVKRLKESDFKSNKEGGHIDPTDGAKGSRP